MLGMLRFIISILVLFLAACSSQVASPTSMLSPQVIRGKGVFDSYCSSCHSTNSGTIVVGPSLAGIATRGGAQLKDMDAEMYIRNSILDPNVYTVEGFPEGIMPSTLKDEIPKEDLEAVIEYLMTLK